MCNTDPQHSMSYWHLLTTLNADTAAAHQADPTLMSSACTQTPLCDPGTHTHTDVHSETPHVILALVWVSRQA